MDFVITSLRHRFDSARDAINAVSVFESQTQSDYQYDIRISYDNTYVVEVHTSMNDLLGNLAPGNG